MKQKSQFITERVRELRRVRGVNVNLLLGKSYLDSVEQGFKEYGETGMIPHSNNGNNLYFYQHPERKVVSALEYLDCIDEHVASFRYAFLTSDGIVLPDPECLGEISGREHAVYQCLQMVLEGFSQWKVEYIHTKKY